MNTFTFAFLFMLVLSSAIRLWLAGRQRAHVLHHRDRVPSDFANQVTLDSHQKSADYTAAHMRLEQGDIVYSAILLLAWTLGGGLQQLDQAWQPLNWPVLSHGIAVILSMMLINQFLEMPLALYRTFKLEQRFGFNRTSVALYCADLGREIVLSLLLGVPLIAAALWLMASSGDLWWLYVWLLWISFSLLMLWAYPSLIAPLFNRFSALNNQELKDRIEDLLNKTGFHSNGIFIMDGSRRSGHGNAYFTGLGRQKRIVFYDTLIETLTVDETEAVLAHELGHYRRRHIHQHLALMAVMSLLGCALLGWLATQAWFYHGLGVQQASAHMALLLFLLTIPVMTFFIYPLLMQLTRRHEFEADDFAVTHTASRPLINALIKMYEENAATLTPDPLYSAFHDSHPPAPVRIAHLAAK